jgi:hypothetical protein
LSVRVLRPEQKKSTCDQQACGCCKFPCEKQGSPLRLSDR